MKKINRRRRRDTQNMDAEQYYLTIDGTSNGLVVQSQVGRIKSAKVTLDLTIRNDDQSSFLASSLPLLGSQFILNMMAFDQKFIDSINAPPAVISALKTIMSSSQVINLGSIHLAGQLVDLAEQLSQKAFYLSNLKIWMAIVILPTVQQSQWTEVISALFDSANPKRLYLPFQSIQPTGFHFPSSTRFATGGFAYGSQ